MISVEAREGRNALLLFECRDLIFASTGACRIFWRESASLIRHRRAFLRLTEFSRLRAPRAASQLTGAHEDRLCGLWTAVRGSESLKLRWYSSSMTHYNPVASEKVDVHRGPWTAPLPPDSWAAAGPLCPSICCVACVATFDLISDLRLKGRTPVAVLEKAEDASPPHYERLSYLGHNRSIISPRYLSRLYSDQTRTPNGMNDLDTDLGSPAPSEDSSLPYYDESDTDSMPHSPSDPADALSVHVMPGEIGAEDLLGAVLKLRDQLTNCQETQYTPNSLKQTDGWFLRQTRGTESLTIGHIGDCRVSLNCPSGRQCSSS